MVYIHQSSGTLTLTGFSRRLLGNFKSAWFWDCKFPTPLKSYKNVQSRQTTSVLWDFFIVKTFHCIFLINKLESFWKKKILGQHLNQFAYPPLLLQHLHTCCDYWPCLGTQGRPEMVGLGDLLLTKQNPYLRKS